MRIDLYHKGWLVPKQLQFKLYAIVPGGQFDTNYIIFRNDEIFQKINFSEIKIKNLIEYLRIYINPKTLNPKPFETESSKLFKIIWQACVEVAKVLLLPYLARLFIFPNPNYFITFDKLWNETNICMKGWVSGFWVDSGVWGRVKENTFGIQSMFKQTQKFGPQL